MTVINETALKKRARSLLVAMTERDRYIYALPREGNFAKVVAVIEGSDFTRKAEDANGAVLKYASIDEQARLVVFDNAALDVVLLEAYGADTVPVMQAILEQTGFCAQSKLLALALDVGNPDALLALQILAHMAVVWDEDWTDLFLLHLASPDAVVRRTAVDALVVAAMVAQDPAPARELLAEARSREKLPKLAKTIEEADKLLGRLAGEPVDASDMG